MCALIGIIGLRPAAVDQVEITRGGENAICASVPCGLTSQSSLWDYIYGDQFEDEAEYNEKVLPILYTLVGKYPQWLHEKLVGMWESLELRGERRNSAKVDFFS